jgi:hypothetical protein
MALPAAGAAWQNEPCHRGAIGCWSGFEMLYGAACIGTIALIALAFASPRATIIVIILATFGFLGWWVFAPETKYENQPPPRVVAPS